MTLLSYCAVSGEGKHPISDGEVERLSRAADAVYFAIRRARTVGADQDGGLSLPQASLLEPLAREERLPVGALAAHADVTIPTATRMLQQLETRGLVTRTRSTEDERRVLVGLTDEGADRLHTVLSRRRARQSRAFATFTAQERSQLLELTHRLVEAMNDPGL
ncbi:DNA-binding MarR family transcriptional regulator [Crossiella equi]|uniref:DNA-binding MarR family transcriptional regulator n=1 Tax=Crossiella equi TaxID=130796 RepID=A0ABS5A8T1_9PSEU|nr:MarR family transcriptional regulator [Crossiella equi]MBP2472707.1 DNA-binding MarR family transcriptional regulator [Crossiella equi]